VVSEGGEEVGEVGEWDLEGIELPVLCCVVQWGAPVVIHCIHVCGVWCMVVYIEYDE
jgi:hypothetical protein